MKKLSEIILLMILISGCVSTQVRGYTDTKYSDYKIRTIAVLAISDDIGLSVTIENSLSELFLAKGIRSVKSTDIIPPTRNYSIEEIREKFQDQDIHSLLIVEVMNSDKSSQTVGYQTYGTRTDQLQVRHIVWATQHTLMFQAQHLAVPQHTA